MRSTTFFFFLLLSYRRRRRWPQELDISTSSSRTHGTFISRDICNVEVSFLRRGGGVAGEVGYGGGDGWMDGWQDRITSCESVQHFPFY